MLASCMLRYVLCADHSAAGSTYDVFISLVQP